MYFLSSIIVKSQWKIRPGLWGTYHFLNQSNDQFSPSREDDVANRWGHRSWVTVAIIHGSIYLIISTPHWSSAPEKLKEQKNHFHAVCKYLSICLFTSWQYNNSVEEKIQQKCTTQPHPHISFPIARQYPPIPFILITKGGVCLELWRRASAVIHLLLP